MLLLTFATTNLLHNVYKIVNKQITFTITARYSTMLLYTNSMQTETPTCHMPPVCFGAFWVVFFTVQLPVLHAKRYNVVSSPYFLLLFRFKKDLVQIKES